MDIIIECNMLTRKGQDLISYAQQLGDKIRNLTEKIETLSTSWNSTTGVAYVNMMQEKFVNPLNDLISVLEDRGNFMINVAKTYSMFEEYYYNKKIISTKSI